MAHREPKPFLSRTLDAPSVVWYASNLKPPVRSQRSTRVRMEPSQRPSSEWEQLFSIAPCGLVLLDSHAVIQFLNPSAGRLLGLDHEALGHPLTDVLPT